MAAITIKFFKEFLEILMKQINVFIGYNTIFIFKDANTET